MPYLSLCKQLSAAVALSLPLVLGACAENTLRVATHAQLETIDPIWTTAYITRTHGYLVYDTLFALDENLEPRPQMVDTWTVSPDQKVWTFKLRDGLTWSDGTPVTAQDCVASLERWAKRDGMGQQLFRNVSGLAAPDAKTIVMTLRTPYQLVLESLAKMSSNVPFMMPKRVADADPYTPIQDATGSGPYVLEKGKWQPGSEAFYAKNTRYVPRAEPESLAAGGKIAKADEIELRFFPNQADAVNALLKGDIDYLESPSIKFLPALEADPNITVASTDPLGNLGIMRFNSAQPPFNNPQIRRAVLMALNQDDYMTAALQDHRWWRTCYSIYPCGTVYSTDTGNQIMRIANIDAAKRALQAAKYDGTPVVILNPIDSPVLSAFTRVTADTLRKIGMKVEVQDMNWSTLLERRMNRGPVAQGGWSIFDTWWIAADLADPTAIAFSGDPATGWAGWPKDQELETDRIAFANATTLADKKVYADKVQARLMDIGALGVLGQFFEPVAFRKSVTGITSPIQFYWNLSPE